jgi:hypothetical protein
MHACGLRLLRILVEEMNDEAADYRAVNLEKRHRRKEFPESRKEFPESFAEDATIYI